MNLEEMRKLAIALPFGEERSKELLMLADAFEEAGREQEALYLRRRAAIKYRDRYNIALSSLNGRTTKKVAGNTYLHLNDAEMVALEYYGTVVVWFYPDGTFKLSHGRHKTATTKRRINDWCPFRVWQKDYEWFIGMNPFVNRMVVDDLGNRVG
jgi:hypothetical protein